MNIKVEQAMILAAGKGTRLRPLTLETPKVLLPISDKPLIEYTLNWLAKYGISKVAINLHYLGEKIKEFLGDGSPFGVDIHYSFEETLLGTAGGVKKMEHFFNDRFVVVYGDIIPSFNLHDMFCFHREKRAIATLALWEVPQPKEVGVVEINERGKVLTFREKPIRFTQNKNLVNGGVYLLEKEFLDYIPDKGFFDFAYDIFPKTLRLNIPIYGYVLRRTHDITDVGTFDKYQRATGVNITDVV